jgi:hypothetical protein
MVRQVRRTPVRQRSGREHADGDQNAKDRERPAAHFHFPIPHEP